jgi:hypothetical protein
MLADIGQYLWDLAEHWAAFMTGGIPAALILIVERLRGKQLPLRAFVMFLAFGFVAASYQAHNQLSDELRKTRLANEGLRTDLRATNDQLAEARRQLADALKWRPALAQPAPAWTTAIQIRPEAKGTRMENVFIQGAQTGLDNAGTIPQ